MSNRSSNEIVIILGIAFFALAAWVSKVLDLNLLTALQVVLGHIAFITLMAAAIYLVKKVGVRWTLFLPISIVAYLLCWAPALNYWANQNIGSMVFGGRENSIWYATGWIQALIALSILVVGYGLIYYFDKDREWPFD